MLELSCVFIARRPESIFASTMRRPAKFRRWLGPRAPREAFWLRVRLADMWRAFLALPEDRRLFLDFDDFLAAPADGLRRALRMAGAEVEDDWFEERPAIDPTRQHIFVGNPELLGDADGEIRIRPREVERTLTGVQRLAFHLGWLGFREPRPR